MSRIHPASAANASMLPLAAKRVHGNRPRLASSAVWVLSVSMMAIASSTTSAGRNRPYAEQRARSRARDRSHHLPTQVVVNLRGGHGASVSSADPIAPNGGVAEIDIVPIPEGPPSVPFQCTPTAQEFRPLAQIERFIPDPLPAPLFQGSCGIGGNMVVILGNGNQVTYGPCFRPASIEHCGPRRSTSRATASVRQGVAPAAVRGRSALGSNVLEKRWWNSRPRTHGPLTKTLPRL